MSFVCKDCKKYDECSAIGEVFNHPGEQCDEFSPIQKRGPGRPKKVVIESNESSLPHAVEKHLDFASSKLIKTIEETKSRIDLLNKELRMQQEELQEIQEFLSQEDKR